MILIESHGTNVNHMILIESHDTNVNMHESDRQLKSTRTTKMYMLKIFCIHMSKDYNMNKSLTVKKTGI